MNSAKKVCLKLLWKVGDELAQALLFIKIKGLQEEFLEWRKKNFPNGLFESLKGRTNKH